MIQRHLFDSGNVIEYDCDAWRTCPRKFTCDTYSTKEKKAIQYFH